MDVADALIEVAAKHRDHVMPGYTHTQRAQPVIVAHHLLAYVAMLQRDASRLQEDSLGSTACRSVRARWPG